MSLPTTPHSLSIPVIDTSNLLLQRQRLRLLDHVQKKSSNGISDKLLCSITFGHGIYQSAACGCTTSTLTHQLSIDDMGNIERLQSLCMTHDLYDWICNYLELGDLSGLVNGRVSLILDSSSGFLLSQI